MQSKYAFVFTTLALSALAGCADTSNTSVNNTEQTPTTAAPVAATKSSASTAVKSAVQPVVVHKGIEEDGTVAEFDKQSVELSDDARANIASLLDAATKSHHVEITGYCYRADDEKNARELAIARANAVRSEFIRLGVAAKKLHVKYMTTAARHAVIVVIK